MNNNEEGTDNNNMASVYIRKGSIEVEHNPQGAGSLADTGMGYVEAGRFVSNALDTDGKSLATPYVAGAGDEGKEGIGDYYTGETADYDRYMVNPAYTSVMHDIKLTTRGGARLSDILPDFINKGIYVVTNTYQDNINVNQLMPDVVGGQVVASGAEENVMGEKGYAGVNRWASEFLGIVPAPLCPPGYAKVITITPAGFKMAQAGRMLKTTMNNPYGGREDRFYIDIGESANITNMANAYDSLGAEETASYSTWKEQEVTVRGVTDKIYYLGYEDGGASFKPEPLYFQQSTWLRSEANPAYLNETMAEVAEKLSDTNKENDPPSTDFVGWATKMGFIYPSTQYGNIIKKLMGTNDISVGYYWNVFPVETATLEGYATVYCYFYRSNIFDSGNDPRYVDQYDQLNNFRPSGVKFGDTRDNAGGDNADNNAYIERLNDPTLSYTDPW